MNHLLFILYFVIFICFWIIFNQYAKDLKKGFNEYFLNPKYRKEINRGKKHVKLANINDRYDVSKGDLMSHFIEDNTKMSKEVISTSVPETIEAPNCVYTYFSAPDNKSALTNFF